MAILLKKVSLIMVKIDYGKAYKHLAFEWCENTNSMGIYSKCSKCG